RISKKSIFPGALPCCLFNEHSNFFWIAEYHRMEVLYGKAFFVRIRDLMDVFAYRHQKCFGFGPDRYDGVFDRNRFDVPTMMRHEVLEGECIQINENRLMQ